MILKYQRSILLGSLLLVLGIPTVSHADGRHHFRENEWRGGRWVHDRHDGRLGWWWVVGPAWTFYSRPYYAPAPRTVVIQQAPPVTVIQPAPTVTEVQPPAPPQNPVIYYCRATGTNYPETMSCPGGWTTMTANTPPQP